MNSSCTNFQQPAWDILVTLYAIHHLCRRPMARTPASSASYHFFALFMDVGLTPFYVFTALFSNNNYTMEPGTKDRWNSFFPQKGATTTLLLATFLASAVMAGLHLISSILDLWLVIVFRKISKLPPDMNPLEDNLTSRGPGASKHKHKNSELTLVGSMAEKKPAYLSGSTVSVDDRSRLSTATKEADDFRRVPFHHSRTDSEATFSPHNPDSARWSRQHYGEVNMYQQPRSARSSQVYNHARTQSNSPSKYNSLVEHVDLNNSRPSSAARPGQQYNPSRFSEPTLPNVAPSNALVVSQQKQSLLNSNWTSIDDDVSPIGTPTRHRTPGPYIQIDQRDSFDVKPLGMNPPTPPPPKHGEYHDFSNNSQKRGALTERRDNGNGYGELNRHLTVISNGTEGSSVYSESAPPLKPNKPNSSPKAKYYGNLSAATRGVRGMKSNDTIKSNGTVAAATMDSTGFCALGDYGYAPDPPPKSPKKHSKAGGNGRVVSRTGVDIVDAQGMYPADNGGFGIRGRRDVSGKVAEEGRGGRGWMWGRHYQRAMPE